MRAYTSDVYIEHHLKELNNGLGKAFCSEVIVIRSPIRFGLDTETRLVVEDLVEIPPQGTSVPNRLSVILETTGGYVEVVERLYCVFRKHYEFVDFIIPNFAYSAGTVLALSGDEIYMDYFSVLGPIDPQFETDGGKFAPGLGYLHTYNELISEINRKPAEECKAEIAFLLKKFDPAILFSLEQATNHSRSLLEKWLPLHKFKNWTHLETQQIPVTDADKRTRAAKIAEILGDAKRWHSHGRGIGINELTSEEIKLKINDFGASPELSVTIRQYNDLIIDYGDKIGANNGLIHTRHGLRRL